MPDPEWGERRRRRRRRSAGSRRGAGLGGGGAAAHLGATRAGRGGRDSLAGQREGRPTRPEGAAVKVYSIPLRTRFRGIDGAGGRADRRPGGVGRVQPVPGVRRPRGGAVAALRDRGRRRRVAAAGAGRGARERDGAGGPGRAGAHDRDRGWLCDREGQGGRARTDDRRRRTTRRGGARRDRAGRRDPRGRQRGLGRRRGGDRDPAARPGRRWAGVRRAAVCRGRGPRRRTTCGRRADRGGRVDPPGRGPLPGARPARRRHRGAEGAAAGRGACLPAHRRGDRDARGRVERAGDVGRDRRRRRAGRRPAGAALRVRAGDGPAAHRRRDRHAAAAGRRRAAGGPSDAVARGARPARRARPTGWRTGRPGCGRSRRLVR